MKLNLMMVTIIAAILGCGDTEGKSNDADASNSSNNVNNTQNTTNNANAANSFDPGVAPDTPSNELDDEDRTRICQELGAYTDQLGRPAALCILTAYGAAEDTDSMDTEELRQTCQESLDNCVMQVSGQPSGGKFCSPVDNCSGTVAQGVACAIDATEGLISATSELPGCDAITFESLGLPYQIQLPPSPPCGRFNVTCE